MDKSKDFLPSEAMYEDELAVDYKEKGKKSESVYISWPIVLSHREDQVTCLSNEFGNFRRIVTAQTTNVKN